MEIAYFNSHKYLGKSFFRFISLRFAMQWQSVCTFGHLSVLSMLQRAQSIQFRSFSHVAFIQSHFRFVPLCICDDFLFDKTFGVCGNFPIYVGPVLKNVYKREKDGR